MNIYDIFVKSRDGKEVALKDYEGKVLLIVNTATGCGFTPQYKGLEELYQKYHDKGLEILDFPCDQFGHQAPGDDDEIHEFCTMKYHTTFDQFKKIEVNGENAIPLYNYLKSQKGFAGFTGAKGLLFQKSIRIIRTTLKSNGILQSSLLVVTEMFLSALNQLLNLKKLKQQSLLFFNLFLRQGEAYV